MKRKLKKHSSKRKHKKVLNKVQEKHFNYHFAILFFILVFSAAYAVNLFLNKKDKPLVPRQKVPVETIIVEPPIVEPVILQPEPIPATEIFTGEVPKEIVYGDRTKKQVIFTFDGGSGSESALKIMEVLKKHSVTGTFFVTAKWIIQNPDLALQMKNEGHEIFNHTYTHPYLTKLTVDEVTKELIDTEKIFHQIVGTTSKPFFRPPYGDRNSAVLKAAAQAGFQSIYWTVDAWDWKVDITADEVKQRIFNNVSPGAIYLMHIGDVITGDILDEVFTTLKLQGYELVSLREGL
ncbi:MAG: polysaccharide deacetylase family protein [bacterium]|nr:polysaccharide deacetylase family protein [bacterium]